MKKIQTDSNKVVTQPKDILCEQKKFYEKLYTSDQSVRFEMDIKLDS